MSSGRVTTMDDIAELAGVAKSTVSRALQGDARVKPATRERIAALARKHGYAVNSNARKLRQKRSNTIAVGMHLPMGLAHGSTTSFVFQLLAAVANGLWIRRQDLLLCSPESERPLAYHDMLASKGADGIIFLGQGPSDDWLRSLARTNAPFVVWGAIQPGAPYCTVGSDNHAGGILVGQRFRTLRRKRVAFLGSRDHPEFAQRYEGLKQGLGADGEHEVVGLDVDDFSFERALDRMKAYLKDPMNERPDAIFAASDTFAMAAIEAIQAEGLTIPDDVSIIGYDDMAMAAHFNPSLTTVRQDTQQAGSLLVEKLFQILDGGRPTSTALPTQLVVRAT